MPDSDTNVHLLLLHQLWQSLSRGDESSKRPALPTELVTLIFRFADDLHVPIYPLNISIHPSSAFTIRGFGSPLGRTYMFTRRLTPSLTFTLQRSLARLDIGITSRDQGWAEDGTASHSWFEIALCRFRPFSSRVQDCLEPRKVTVTHGEGNEESSVKSLTWRVYENEIGEPEFKRATVTLGPEHEMWKWVEVEDHICLMVCVQHPGWENQLQDTSFRFFKLFKPVI